MSGRDGKSTAALHAGARGKGRVDGHSATEAAPALGGTSVLGTGGRATQTLSSPGGEAAPLFPGLRVQQYELIRELGRGGMGQVFLARDTKLGRLVALKFLTTTSPELTARLLAEAQATAQCGHENIIVIHEVNEHAGTPYMVLEYLEGEPLGDIVASGALPAQRAIELIVPVVRALVKAHEFGIVHRDLKPDNIFVTSSGTIKVLDFGIAKVLAGQQTAGGTGPGSTIDGALVGTPLYMSPEQLGVSRVDARTDIWAIGIILYELVAGEPPHLDMELVERMANAVDADTPMPDVRSAAPNVPEALAAVIDKCLRKVKQDRYDDAIALLEDLEPLLPVRAGRRLGEGESPYPGLVAFQESDADRFFGRGAEAAKLATRLRDQPLLAVVGPSGAGKSSFVRAGLIPLLKERGPWDARVIRPGRHPMNALTQLLVDVGADASGDLASEPGLFGARLRALARAGGRQLLVFIDQFEEIYTLADEVERRAFTACLGGAADDASTPLRVVVSMRSDFLDRAAEDPLFMDQLARGLFFLRAPGRLGLLAALTEPVQMYGYSFESPELTARMLDALESTPGALPLLQFAASRMWDARDRDKKLITRASYDAIGGIAGALAAHADEVLADRPAATQRLVRAIFMRLVTPERTRDVVDITELEQIADPGEVRRLIDQLIDARLLLVQNRGDADAPAVELVHESMISSWPTLRRWLDESEEDAANLSELRGAAKQWDSRGRPNGLLWRGEALASARRWHERYRGELAARESEFLDAAVVLVNRTVRRRRAVLIGAFTLLSGLVVIAFIAVAVVRDAEKKARASETDAVEAKKNAQEAEKTALSEKQVAEDRLRQLQESRQATAAAEKLANEATSKARAGEKALEMSKEDLRAALDVAEANEAAAKVARDKATAAQRSAEANAAELASSKKDLVRANAELKRQKKKLQRQLDDAKKARKEISTQLD